MGTLIDSPVFPAGVQHFEANAVLTGGPDCPDNLPLQDLANRTAWLKQQVESAQSGLAGHEVAADPHPQYLTTAEGDAAIAAAVAALVNSSPATLDTLAEFATALNNDPDFATTVSNAISAKVSKSDAQTQTYTAFTTTGAAGTFVLSPVPAITAYSVGKRFRAKFHTTGNGADTINISALGAKSLKQYDASGSKVAAVIASGQLADIEYDGVDVVILDPLPASTGTTPSQFDNSTKVATTGFIKSVGKSFSGVVSVGASATLDATYAGKLVLASSNGLVLTLPAASSYPSGAAISFLGGGWASANTIQRAGTDAIYPNGVGGGITSFSLNYGDTITLVSNGSNSWYVADGNATAKHSGSFSASLAENGFQMLPSGLIWQWGRGTSSGASAGNATPTFPVAFPNAVLKVIANQASSDGAVRGMNVPVTFPSNTQVAMTAQIAGVITSGCVYFWDAIGY